MAGFNERVKEFVHERELADDVSEELSYDPSVVGADKVDVSAAEGVVTLEGEVDSLAQRWAIERAVRRVAGVTDVNNDLVVVPPANLDRTDDQIENAVNILLEWTATLPAGIKATVAGGWVTLEGTVGFRFQKQAAENAVRQLVGVRGVENDLVVATAEAAQDIKAAIGSAIRRRADHPVDIEVAFDDGTVTLRGTVHSWAERRTPKSRRSSRQACARSSTRCAFSHESDRPEQRLRRWSCQRFQRLSVVSAATPGRGLLSAFQI